MNLVKKVCENKGFCNIVMPFEDTKILEFSQYKKFDKATFQIFQCLQYCYLKKIENKHDIHRRKDCMKKFYESLREHAIEIINSKKKKNEVINKRAAGIIWKCKNLLHL